MFANLLQPNSTTGPYATSPTAPVPAVEEAQTPEDFKRIELKLSQMGLYLSLATVILTIYGLHKGR